MVSAKYVLKKPLPFQGRTLYKGGHYLRKYGSCFRNREPLKILNDFTLILKEFE